MNPKTEAEAIALAKASDIRGLVVAPPFVFIEGVKKVLKNAALGSQNVFYEGSGPYTGEVSADELQSLGVKYVIVGHSERRALGETDEQVAKKVRVVLEANMMPVLCVGESAAERASGKTHEVIERQLRIGLSLISPILHLTPYTFNLVIAYEPLWAIGTGIPNTPQDTVKMVQYIRSQISNFQFPISNKVLYGGSVDATNAESFLKEKEIDGALVGGASLKPSQIKKIVEIANN